MIKPLELSLLQQRFGGRLINGDTLLQTISTDTRTINEGDIFVALRGENFDGHDFLNQAQEKLVAALVVDSEAENITIPQWIVEDTTVALGWIAEAQRDCFRGKLVAITGSGGKTTVKGMLQSILQAEVGESAVFATRGNLNNHIGVPFSLFELTEHHRYAVIEMGASGMGEIAYLTAMAKPDVALVNNVMPAHVEGFGSVDNIAIAKGEIYEGLNAQGIAVVNLDDRYAHQWLEQNKGRHVMGFSQDAFSSAEVSCSDKTITEDGNVKFILHFENQSLPVQLSVMGMHNVANALAAATCACALGVGVDSIVAGLSVFGGVGGRLQRLTGLVGSIVIDDSYNANPGSMKAAIDVLAKMEGKKILLMGDMGELGNDKEQYHEIIGQYASEKEIDVLMATGVCSRFAVDAFRGDAYFFNNGELLIEQAKKIADKNSVFLVKGSRSARMDRVVNALVEL